MSVEDLRKRIDEADAEIVRVIAQRLRIAEELGKRKRERGAQIEDKARERVVLGRIKDIARAEDISEEDIESIYEQVITVCRRMQQTTVAFQGVAGAYSEEAALGFFGPSAQTQPYESFDEVFKAVEGDEASFGIVPVENSLEGSISRVYDLLLDSKLMVCGEIELRVVHCLIGSSETRLDLVRKVYSHPQALGQCRGFLRHLDCELIATYDTAGSVRMLKEKGIVEGAAVASARAAEIYGMKIISRGIEDNRNNFTRFFVLSEQDSPPSGNDKTSIVFSIREEPGSLYRALKKLAVRRINLTKLESRPTRQKPWQYNFYLDCEGHREDSALHETLAELERTSLFVKVLGSYPRAKPGNTG